MKMDYTVEQISSVDELAKMGVFVNENFMPDMPLIRAFGLTDNPPKSSSTDNPKGEPDAIYIKAVDSHGDSIGYAINRVNPFFSAHTGASQGEIKFVEFMKYFEKEALPKAPQLKTIELRVLSVVRGWRRQGVGRRLTEESMKLAREAGFQAMSAICTSEYSARLVRGMGWRDYYRLAHQDHPMVLGQEVVLQPNPPHDTIYYYITDL